MQLSIILHTAKFDLRDAMVDGCLIVEPLANSSELNRPMLLGRGSNPQFNVVLNMTTLTKILLGPQIFHRFCLE